MWESGPVNHPEEATKKPNKNPFEKSIKSLPVDWTFSVAAQLWPVSFVDNKMVMCDIKCFWFGLLQKWRSNKGGKYVKSMAFAELGFFFTQNSSRSICVTVWQCIELIIRTIMVTNNKIPTTITVLLLLLTIITGAITIEHQEGFLHYELSFADSPPLSLYVLVACASLWFPIRIESHWTKIVRTIRYIIDFIAMRRQMALDGFYVFAWMPMNANGCFQTNNDDTIRCFWTITTKQRLNPSLS